jgi:hypothetical protein
LTTIAWSFFVYLDFNQFVLIKLVLDLCDVCNQQYESKFKERDIKHALPYLTQFFIIDNEKTIEEDALNP